MMLCSVHNMYWYYLNYAHILSEIKLEPWNNYELLYVCLCHIVIIIL